LITRGFRPRAKVRTRQRAKPAISTSDSMHDTRTTRARTCEQGSLAIGIPATARPPRCWPRAPSASPSMT
jgi:hypothetical protein